MTSHIKILSSILITILMQKCSITNGSCLQERHHIFIKEPTDVTVNEGSDANFYCSVSASGETSFTWYVSPEGSRSHSVRVNTTSTLTIYNVGRVEYYIFCKVEIFYQPPCSYRLTSRRATMVVNYFPRRDEITCKTLNNSLNVSEGDNMYIQCQVPRGNPPVDIGWHMDGHTFRQRSTYKMKGLTITSVQRTTVSRSMQGKSFSCLVSSGLLFPGDVISCSIGPLDVQTNNTGVTNDAVTTFNPVHDHTRDALDDVSTSIPNTVETMSVPLDNIKSSLKVTEWPTTQTAVLTWKRRDALLVVFVISGVVGLLAVFVTSFTCIQRVHLCTPRARCDKEQEQSDIKDSPVLIRISDSDINDLRFTIGKCNKMKVRQNLIHEKRNIDSNDIDNNILNKTSLQSECMNRTSLRYSDAWSSISSMSLSSAEVEDTANVSLKTERGLLAPISLGGKFLVDISDVYVIKKLDCVDSRRSSLGFLLLNHPEAVCSTSDQSPLTLPRELMKRPLSIEGCSQTTSLTLSLSSQQATVKTLRKPHNQPSILTGPGHCDQDESNSSRFVSKECVEAELHEETKL